MQFKNEDTLPKYLCQQCFDDITHCHKFIERYEKSEQILLPLLKQIEITTKAEQETQLNRTTIKTEQEPHLDLIKRIKIRRSGRRKLYMCDKCGQLFTVLRSLITHSETKHIEQNLYKCSFCGKEFLTEALRYVHEQIHTQERPFKCEFCDKTFVTKLQRTMHEGSHSREHPHVCEVCNRGFCNRWNLKKHYRKHWQENSDQREKEFAEKRLAIVHERTHSEEIKFEGF